MCGWTELVVQIEKVTELCGSNFHIGLQSIVVVVVVLVGWESPCVVASIGSSVHWQLFHRPWALLLLWGNWGRTKFIKCVDKMTTRAIRAESHTVVGPTQVRLILGMSVDVPQFVLSVSELAFLSVLAATVLLVRPAKLRLVTGAWLLLLRGWGAGAAGRLG
jgi:hypothetical protein